MLLTVLLGFTSLNSFSDFKRSSAVIQNMFLNICIISTNFDKWLTRGTMISDDFELLVKFELLFKFELIVTFELIVKV